MTQYPRILLKIFAIALTVPTATQTPEYVFSVTSLDSSVMASGRRFACAREEVVYSCVAVRNDAATMNNVAFQTEWRWGDEQVGVFSSEQRIGTDNTCNSDATYPFLHATLVLTNSTTCISLLIVVPSQMPPRDSNTEILCGTTSDHRLANQPRFDNSTIDYNNVSGVPQWDDMDGAQNQINVSCYNLITSGIFLLTVSWPEINNSDSMDLEVYTLEFKMGYDIDKYVVDANTTSYKYLLQLISETDPDADINVVQIKVDAVNRCNSNAVNPLQVNYSLTIDSCSVPEDSTTVTESPTTGTYTTATKSTSGDYHKIGVIFTIMPCVLAVIFNG